MKSFFTAKRLCRAGIIASLYVILTYVFGSLSHQGFLQIRPAEALCVLPLFFPEAIFGLTIGCAIANLSSPFFLYDVVIGSAITLIASICTYFIGKGMKGWLSFFIGGLFPVLLNGFGIPVVIVFLTGGAGNMGVWTAYFTFAGSILFTQSVWVYLLGGGLYAWLKNSKRMID